MKPNYVMMVIAVCMSALLGYLVFTVAEGKENAVLCGIIATICFAGSMIPMYGLKCDDARIGVNMRVMATMFFIIFLISQFAFAIFGVKMPYYLIVNGLLLLFFIGAVYRLSRVVLQQDKSARNGLPVNKRN